MTEMSAKRKISDYQPPIRSCDECMYNGIDCGGGQIKICGSFEQRYIVSAAEKKSWPKNFGGPYASGYTNQRKLLSQEDLLQNISSKMKKSTSNTYSTKYKSSNYSQKPIRDNIHVTTKQTDRFALLPSPVPKKVAASGCSSDYISSIPQNKPALAAFNIPKSKTIIYDGVKIDLSNYDHRTYLFLEKTYYDFLEDLRMQESIHSITNFTNKTGKLPDYTNRINQEIYTLRYFLANFVEYFVMFSTWYKLIYSVTHYKQNRYDILSVGCGSTCDYLALYYVLNSNGVGPGIDYIGVDICSWELVTSPINERQIETNDIVMWLKQDPNKFIDTDMIVFAKSIGDLSSNTFDELLQIIFSNKYKLNKNRISILGSFDKRFHERDIKRYSMFIDVIRRKNGFTKYKRCHSNYPTDASGHSIFKEFYPEMISMQRKSLERYCSLFYENQYHCEKFPCPNQVLQDPITSTQHIDYVITILEK